MTTHRQAASIDHVHERPPLLQVKDLTVEFSTAAGVARALDQVSLRGAPRARRSRSSASPARGKSTTAQAIMALLPKPAGAITGGKHPLRRARPRGRCRCPRCASSAAAEIAMIFQDPLSSLNPVFRVGAQIAEPLRRRRGMGKQEAWAKALRPAQAGRHPGRRDAHPRLPAPVLRRAAPADHDRDGARARTRSCSSRTSRRRRWTSPFRSR